MRMSDWSSDVCSSDLNEFRGSFFWDRTSEAWREPSPIEEDRGFKTEELTEQYGATFSGPIIRDKLHFFMLYEAKDFIVPRAVAWPAVFDPNTLPPELRASYGPHNVPFNAKLYFGKLRFQSGDAHLLELSLPSRSKAP